MTWARRVLSALLVSVGTVGFAVTAYALGAAFGYYSVVVGSPLKESDLSSLAVGGGTLFVGAAIALLTVSWLAAEGDTRDKVRVAREMARARLLDTAWILRAVFIVLVVLAMAGLAIACVTLGAAFGLYTLGFGSVRVLRGDESSLALAGGTLFLGAATALLTLSTSNAAAETRNEARLARATSRARLDITFDKALPVLWATDVSYVRVMVVNQGPAMAHHVVVTLERIEAHNPMLDAQFQVFNGPLITGTNVLPSRLDWKGHDSSRDLEVLCDLNPKSREYFDVLGYSWQNNSPWAVFWIHEWREAFKFGSSFAGNQPPSPLVLNTEYDLYVSASAANPDRVERVFKFKADAMVPHFDFWRHED